jgi:exodeoxyribonuclease V beta subunit
VVPGDIAVLTRTNDQAFQIQAALRQRGVASVVLGDKSVYASSEAADLERVLRAVVEPANNRLVRAALTTDLVGLTGSELHALDEADGEWESWLAAFHEFSAIWSQTGFVQMMRVLMSRCRVPERWLQLGDGQRRMTNLLQLVELLHAAGMQGHLGPSGIFAFLARARRREVLGMEAEAAQIRLESDSAAVKITTMHKSKGLEYPIVYCPYSWHGMLLHPNDELAPKLHLADGRLVIDIGSSHKQEHLVQARWEQFAENMRLLYVALTRARHRCTIVWGRIGRNYATSALGYLLHAPPLADAASDVAVIQAHLQSLSDEKLVSDIEAHARQAPITWRFARAAATSPYAPEAEPERPLAARRPRFPIADRFRTSSFSALSSHAPTPDQALVRAEERSRDHDAAADVGFDPEEAGPALIESAPAPIRLAEFPRGAKAGSFFHDILEHYDFVSPRPDALRKLVEARLLSYQYPVEEWSERVAEQIYAVLDTPLASESTSPVRLGDVPLARRLTELEFRLPVASRAGARGHAVAARDLARVFREHPSAALSSRYADLVSELGFIPLEGYLRGYIDLVFEHEGSYFVVDYKANHLGETADSYGPASIETALLGGHYFLQYHLYALALHRYLGQRIRDYDFSRHFGGVFYLFIKGMGPELGASGVFFEKPPLARLSALSELCERGVRHG